MQCRIKNQNLKLYFRIITSLITISLTIIYLKYFSYQKRYNIGKNKLFDKILKLRNLQENSKEKMFDASFDKICDKSNENLREYYITGNLNILDGINNELFYDNNDKDKIQIKSLINIIKILTKENNEKNKNLFYIDSTQKDIKNYLKNNLSVLILLGIGLFSIFDWILLITCSCPRFNFCCCCCIKKKCCINKLCIIITILYLLSFVISLYLVIRSFYIFTDIADIECSIYKFFEQTLEGEGKDTYPKWIGFNKIDIKLVELCFKLEQLETKQLNNLYQKINDVWDKKIKFKNKMGESGNLFYTSAENNIYINLYSNEYNIDSRGINGRYVLDIIKIFGKQVKGINEEKYEPENSVLDSWHNEYKLISKKADDYFDKAINDLQLISYKRKYFEKILENISTLKEFFIIIYENIEFSLIHYSKGIFTNGKIIFNILFISLLCLNFIIIILIFYITCFSDRIKINKISCIQSFINIIANILYLFLIFSFFLGSILIFMGKLGNDIIIALSIILDKNNFEENGIEIFNHLGEAKDYLNVYINGNGSITDLLNINDIQINLFKNTEEFEEQIDKIKYEFENLKKFSTYYNYRTELETRLNLTKIPMLIKDGYQFNIVTDKEQLYDSQTDKYLKLDYELELMNNIIRAQNTENSNIEQWKIDSESPNKCDSGIDPIFNRLEFNLLKCRPINRDWIQNSPNSDLKKEATIISDILRFLENANNNSDHKSLIYVLNDLKREYNEYIELYIDNLISYKDTLNEISSFLRQYNNNKDDNLISFINGKVIGTNLKIIIKYIKSIISTDIKNIGISLIIIGFSLTLSIPFTLILIIIIKNEKKRSNNSIITNINNTPTIITYRHINYSSSSNINICPSAPDHIKEAKQFLIEGCNLSLEIFDKSFDRHEGWRTNDSGPKKYLKKYYPPVGMIGIGLKVAFLYDKDDSDRSWLANDNNPGEWYIAYHGVRSSIAIQKICEEGFRRGKGQAHENDININPLTKDRFPRCGEGVYFSNEINEVKNNYAQPIIYNGNTYKIIFMCRVNPFEVRIAKIRENLEYWIVEGDKLGDLYGKKRSDQVRPYRILMYKVNK